MTSNWIELNRDAWNQRTNVHIRSAEAYPIDKVRAGGSTLCSIERKLVGNVAGCKLLHLQCHFGLDTLSWVRLGAEATGVDCSDTAIDFARGLARDIGLTAEFVRMDVQKLKLPDKFDVAVSTYGALPWIGDLTAWAEGIHRTLRPCGRLVLVEYHPILEILFPGSFSGRESYFGSKRPEIVASSGTYTNRAAPIHYKECRWQHSLSDIIAALLAAGFMLRDLREYPRMPLPLIDGLANEGEWWVDTKRGAPLLFSLVAERLRS